MNNKKIKNQNSYYKFLLSYFIQPRNCMDEYITLIQFHHHAHLSATDFIMHNCTD